MCLCVYLVATGYGVVVTLLPPHKVDVEMKGLMQEWYEVGTSRSDSSAGIRCCCRVTTDA